MISLSADLEKELLARAAAEGLAVDAYIERLVREEEKWESFFEDPLNETDPEFREIHSAVMEGLDQAERGEGRPAEAVFAELRAKHGVPG
jgi:hypothetical protein